jgi:hypothetical protein
VWAAQKHSKHADCRAHDTRIGIVHGPRRRLDGPRVADAFESTKGRGTRPSVAGRTLGFVDEGDETSHCAAAHERQTRDGAFAPGAAFIRKILQQRVDLWA